MGKRQTVTGYWRQRGVGSRLRSQVQGTPTPAVMLVMVPVTFDPSVAQTTGSGVVLPANCIPAFSQTPARDGTGGIAPTFDVGLAGGDADALVNEGDADAGTPDMTINSTGTGWGVELTSDTEITAGQGASAATGGSVTVNVYYYMVDDGSIQD